MKHSAGFDHDAIGLVVSMLERIPEEAAAIHVSGDDFEYVIDIVPFPPAAIAEAILYGPIRETVWRLGNRIVESKCIIRLKDGTELSDTAVGLIPRWLLRATVIEYQPYVRV